MNKEDKFDRFIQENDHVINKVVTRFKRIRGYDKLDLKQEVYIKIWRNFDKIETSNSDPHSIAFRISYTTCCNIYKSSTKEFGGTQIQAIGADIMGIEVRACHQQANNYPEFELDILNLQEQNIVVRDLIQKMMQQLPALSRQIFEIKMSPPAALLFLANRDKKVRTKTHRDCAHSIVTKKSICEYLSISPYDYDRVIQEIKRIYNALIE